MSLDKKFLKYKLERIKNKRIFKDQDTETKIRIRKENAEVAKEEADAIHSYLTGEDDVDALDNKSFLENRLPGSLFLNPQITTEGKKKVWKGELNVRQVQSDPKAKKTKLSALLKRFRTVAKSNLDSTKSLIIFKRIFDSLKLNFSGEEIKLDGDINTQGYKTMVGNSEFKGISDEFQIADVDLDDNGNIIQESYRRAILVVKNGLIVEVRRV
tara:strand:- start:9971 stop:10609 length:639 start_codon:yes stop_codon:yes gene_type:complete